MADAYVSVPIRFACHNNTAKFNTYTHTKAIKYTWKSTPQKHETWFEIGNNQKLTLFFLDLGANFYRLQNRFQLLVIFDLRTHTHTQVQLLILSNCWNILNALTSQEL